MEIARTPAPPYYAVIFTSVLRAPDNPDYAAAAARMIELAQDQPGFLGVETAREGLGITVSYWEDEAAIRAWRDQAEHAIARERGRQEWYSAFALRIARVERDSHLG
ncbi:MAG: antibiotic biosynthesis monooxygenase family protein [Magnetospiraceae bacterium]